MVTGEMLMIEGGAAGQQPLLDALPYIDLDYSLQKAEVDQLVEAEMRRSTKRPADFLPLLPPLPLLDFQSMLQDLNRQIEDLNKERKLNQQSVAIELNGLRSQWKELCQKNIDIENACAKVEGDIMNLKKEAEEKWAV